MLTLSSFLLLSMFISFLFCSNPMTLGLWVFLTTFILSLFMNFFSPSWIPMLLFLIYIGGMLVMFSYFITIEPNQFLGFFKLVCTTSLSLFYLFMIMPSPSVSLLSLSKLHSFSTLLFTYNKFILLLMVILLFMALIIIVKITFSNKAPLRPFMYVLSYTQNPPII
uniref:NADH dehydrogenase subunit 6 n=1 Tax=Myrianida brachycephala TaxID=884646 RepID=A0A1C9UZC9_MYRBC|nr:NADH dehydrogenase subunit 6 [Myrianida brachycephala]AOR87130.1 NADH dehydrogenase subunit 6 [Myrianida brachycephala]